ncbi:nucleotidyltransferase family protein [Halobacillus sp. A5]|uniref:nucleotidyltransferase family protein n=1 Tax=Halobacillus sp. A5 TaxID=2880263 RepID=UPI0020A6AA08|nr:nucleotidyltransferase family protein [Halobacillus sp. A5]MCP3029335.1 nucleotidyltransferase family protein [Halobacillus sp. A5]
MGNDELIQIIKQTEFLQEVFKETEKEFCHYYIGAGCITQSVWNYLSSYPQGYGIGDIDIVYHDKTDLSGREESLIEGHLRQQLNYLPFSIDVTNEARVHLWYEDKFHKPVNPYQTVEEAINTWPSTASSIGIKKQNGRYLVYAPYGVDDLFHMIVRPNKKIVTKEVYEQKALKWKKRWPKLRIFSW